jgi:hypothetical protein
MINQEAVAKRIPSFADLIHEVFSFAGGVNTRASQLFLSRNARFALQSDQLTVGDNIIRTKSGQIEGRPGRVKINSSAVAPPSGDAVIRSMFELRRSDGTDRVCMNAGNTFYYLNGSTWTSVGTFTTANLRRSYCQFKEVILGVDGTNDMMKYDGTTLSAIAAAPKGLVMAAHRNRVFIGKDKTLHYCALGDETDWTTPNNAGAVPVPVSRGKGITGLIPLWDRLIILCHQQVFQLVGTGPQDFLISPINMAYGNSTSCCCPIAAGNDIYFADAKGIHSMSVTETQSLTGDVSYQYASGRIEPSWQRVATGNLQSVFSLHDRQRNLILFFNSTNSNNNDSCWVADYYHLDEFGQPTWTSYSSMPFASGCEALSINGYPELLFGGYDGFVYRQTSAEDDAGQPIAVSVQYVTDMETPQFLKFIRHLLLFTSARGGVLNVSISFDFGDAVFNQTLDVTTPGGAVLGSTFVIGQSPLGSASFKKSRVAIPGSGRFLVVNLNYSSTNRLTIAGFMVYGGARRILNN